MDAATLPSLLKDPSLFYAAILFSVRQSHSLESFGYTKDSADVTEINTYLEDDKNIR